MKYLTKNVSFNVAKQLKEAGFPQELRGVCHAFSGDGSPYNIYQRDNYVAAPTYGHVFDWLLEKGYILLIAPGISPVAYRPGDKITRWQGWMNAEIIAEAETWEECAEKAVINTLKRIAE